MTLVPYEEKSVLYNLIQLYRYDSSEFDGHVLNHHGMYLYKYFDHQWTDEYRRPFIVKVDGEIFYQEQILQNEKWNGPVFVFESAY
nr:hypothetical protein [Paenibacillus alba]